MPHQPHSFLQRDPEPQGAALRLFLRAVEQCLRALGAPIAPPTIAPARGPRWAAMDDAASDAAASDALPANARAPPAPDFVFDQRLAW